VLMEPGRFPFQSAVAHIVLQDTANGPWSAVAVRAVDSTVYNISLIGIVDTGWVIEITGRVEEFPSNSITSSTQIRMIAEPISVISTGEPRPAPAELPITEFLTGAQRPSPTKIVKFSTAERWESGLIIIRNVRVKTRTQSSTTQRWTWSVEDAQGNEFDIDDLSPVFRGGAGSQNFVPPPIGTLVEYVRGVVTQRAFGTSTAFLVSPMYPGDLQLGASPPTIAAVRRTIAIPSSATPVPIKALIKDLDGAITSAKVFYRVNGSTYDSLALSRIASTDTFMVDIPAQAAESLVEFYLVARDDSNLVTQDPGNLTTQRYFYRVLDRSVTIRDVQFCPDLTGNSSFADPVVQANGFAVTVTGVVTADTSDINGGGGQSRRTYIQQGEGAWSGIWISGNNTDDLLKGDSVSVTGTVAEVFGVTRIQSITAQNIHATGRPVPPPAVLTTGEIDLRASGDSLAERWESVYLEFLNTIITNDNADGPSGGTPNFGEMLINDGSGDMRVELQDGNHNLSNGATGTQGTLVAIGDSLRYLRGIMYFSFGNYKHVPRKSDDYEFRPNAVAFSPTVPGKFDLSQNYPNPFNPTTRIRYDIPDHGHATLMIYNVLGQRVATLANSIHVPGTYEVQFSSHHLSTGVYFYELFFEGERSIKKMMIIR
jgi:DNA/RNA endonuclease YhcR with UshA esterase domain